MILGAYTYASLVPRIVREQAYIFFRRSSRRDQEAQTRDQGAKTGRVDDGFGYTYGIWL